MTKLEGKAKGRRAKSMAIAGLAIVGLTFLFKEVLRDQAQEAKTSINEARTASDRASDVFDSSLMNVSLQMRLHEVQKALQTPASPAFVSRGQIAEEVQETFSVEADSEVFLKGIKNLLSAIPDDRSRSLKHIAEADETELKGKKAELVKYAKERWAVTNPKWPDHVLAILPIITIFAFDLKLIPLQEASQKSAADYEEHEQTLYRVYTNAFYVLQTLGWILTAFGVLFGVEAYKAESE